MTGNENANIYDLGVRSSATVRHLVIPPSTKSRTIIPNNFEAIYNTNDVIGIVCIIFESDGIRCFINDYLLSDLGYVRDDLQKLVADGYLNIIMEEDRDATIRRINAGLKKDSRFEVVYRVLAKDGRVVWIKDAGRLLVTEQGCDVIVSTCTDISTLMEEKFAIQSRSDSFEQLTINLPCGICRLDNDDDLTISFANPSFYRLFGYTHEEAQAAGFDTLRFILEDNDFEKCAREGKASAAQGTVEYELECRALCRDGSHRWALFCCKYFPHYDEFSMIALDITQRHEAEENSRIAEEEYRIVCEQSEKLIYRYDIRNKELHNHSMSSAAEKGAEIFMNAPESVIQAGYIDKRDAKVFCDVFDQIDTGVPKGSAVFMLNERGGKQILCRLDFTTIFNEEKHPLYAIISFSDISDQQHKELIYQKWSDTVEARSVEGAVYYEFNLNTGVCELEKGIEGQFNLGLEKPSFDELVTAIRQNGLADFEQQRFSTFISKERLLEGYKNGLREDSLQYQGLKSDGIPTWVEATLQMTRDPYSSDIKLFLLFENIDIRKQAELQIKSQSRTDPLTGLLNRAAFQEDMDRFLTTHGTGVPCAFAIIDLDDFKVFNDTLGHVIGDRVLIDVATSLKSLLREGDLVGRLGGDEFVLFLPHIQDAKTIASRSELICKIIEKPYDTLVSSCTMGIAMVPKDGTSFSELYKKADIALYKGKALGRKQYTFYSDNMREEVWQTQSTPIDPMTLTDAEVEEKRQELEEDIVRRNAELLRHQDENERYRIIMEQSEDIIVEWNLKTGAFYKSPAYDDYVMSLYSRKALMNETDSLDIAHPDDKALFKQIVSYDMGLDSSDSSATLRFKKKDGSYQWTHFECLCVRNDALELERIIFVLGAINLTQEEGRIRLDAIVKHLDGGIMLLEIDTSEHKAAVPLYISPSFYAFTGRSQSKDGYASERISSMVYPDDIEGLRDVMLEGTLAGRRIDYDFRVTGTQGNIAWRNMRAVRIPYEDSDKPVLLAIITDVTKLKESERELHLNQELTTLALQLSAVLSFVYDVASDTTMHSMPHLDMGDIIVPYGAQGIVERGIVHEDSRAALETLYREMREGVPQSSAIVKARKENRYRYTRISYKSVFDEDGKPYKCVAVSEELTTLANAKDKYYQEQRMVELFCNDIIYHYSVDLASGDILDAWGKEGTVAASKIGAFKTYSALQDVLFAKIYDPNIKDQLAHDISSEALKKAFDKGVGILCFEFQRQDDAGRHRWVSLSMRLLVNPHNGNLCAFVYLRDIDIKKRRELKFGLRDINLSNNGIYNATSFDMLAEKALGSPGSKDCFQAMSCIRIDGLSAAMKNSGLAAVKDFTSSFERMLVFCLDTSCIIGKANDNLYMVLFDQLTDEDTAEASLAKLRTALENPAYFTSLINEDISYSMSLVFTGGTLNSFDKLIAAALADLHE